MEQTRAEGPIQSGRATLRPHVPGPPRSAARPARAGDGAAARGEHVHSEPPAPGATAPAEFTVAPPGNDGPTAGSTPDGALRGEAGGAPRGEAPAVPVPPRPRRHSVRDQVLDALRDALLSGELAPGEVYSAPALAERFGVSPTPVREAMQRLAVEGAVETVPNRGFRVAECTARDLAEYAEIRALLEIPAVLRLARTVPPDDWEALRPLAEDSLAAATRGDRAGYAAADRAFHRAVLERTGNLRLADLVEDVQRRAARGPVRHSVLGAAGLLGEASEHLALLDALQARDLVAVERLLHDHLAPPRGG